VRHDAKSAKGKHKDNALFIYILGALGVMAHLALAFPWPAMTF
jgi:hypothetical protein